MLYEVLCMYVGSKTVGRAAGQLMADWCDWAFSHWPVDQMHMTALPETKG